MPSQKQQEKLLQKFMVMPEDFRITVRQPIEISHCITGPSDITYIAWPNPHAVIIQKITETATHLGSSLFINRKAMTGKEIGLADKISLALNKVTACQSDIKIMTDLSGIIKDSRISGRRINKNSGLSARYIVKLGSACYNIDYIDMFGRITGTDAFWFYRPRQESGKEALLLYPVINNTQAFHTGVMLLPVCPLGKQHIYTARQKIIEP